MIMISNIENKIYKYVCVSCLYLHIVSCSYNFNFKFALIIMLIFIFLIFIVIPDELIFYIVLYTDVKI